MEISEKHNDNKNIQQIDSSFEEDINELKNIFENKSSQNFDFKIEQERNFIEKDNTLNIFNNRYFEEADLNEIYDVLNEINQAVTIDIDSTNKEECHIKKKESFSQNNTKVMNEDHFNECQEILSILKKPLSNKNIRNRNIYDTPFKPLLKPKKVSLVGKIFYDIPFENDATECDSKNNNNILLGD